MPRWLSVTVALLAAAVLEVALQLVPGLQGWHRVLWLALGAVFAVLAVGVPELRQWQNQQQHRLQVRLDVDLGHGAQVSPRYADDSKIAELAVAAEKSACLASLPDEQPSRKSHGFDAADAAAKEPDEPGSFQVAKRSGQTVGDFERLVQKPTAEVTAEAQRFIDANYERIEAATKALQASAIFALTSRPDARTVDEYRDEVQRYLLSYAEFINDLMLWRYRKQEIGRLRLTLVNPTDRVFEEVEVEIYLPGEVRAIRPSDIENPGDAGPSRPRPFGMRSKLDLGLGQAILPRSLVTPRLAGRPRGPIIDNSFSARITFEPVLLRPHARVPLPEVVLIVTEPPRSRIAGSWTASATNADGRATGAVSITVSDAPLPVGNLLGNLGSEAD